MLTGTFAPHGGHYTLQPHRDAPPNLRFEFELQGNAAKYRQSSEERQRTRETAEIASRSKMKQSTNNACTKAKYKLKSDFLPVSCFKQRVYQSNIKKRLLACFLFVAGNGTKQRKEAKHSKRSERRFLLWWSCLMIKGE